MSFNWNCKKVEFEQKSSKSALKQELEAGKDNDNVAVRLKAFLNL